MHEGRRRTQALILALVDAAMLLAAMALAWWLRWDLNQWLAERGGWRPFATGVTPAGPYRLAAGVAVPLFWLVFREEGLYREPAGPGGGVFRIGAASLAGAGLLAVLGFFVKERFLFSRAYTLLFWPCSVLTLSAGRGLFRAAVRSLWARGVGLTRVLFVGEGLLADALARALHERGGYELLGVLSAPPGTPAPSQTAPPQVEADSKTSNVAGRAIELKHLGPASALVERVREHRADEVLVALPEAGNEALQELMQDCCRAHVRFRMVPGIYEMLLDHTNLALLGEIPLLGLRGSRIEGLNGMLKRLFDIVLSSVLLLLLSPLLALLALVLAWREGRPVLYSQPRVGYRGETFRFWKFRTMRPGADRDTARHEAYVKELIQGDAAPMPEAPAKDEERDKTPNRNANRKAGRAEKVKFFKLVDDPRVTPLGKALRRHGLDELPQLWNVLKGEMSLIGPRPPLPYEVEHYRPVHLRRLEVRPGISGLWQVSGHNRLSFEEMIKLDLYYIENWSLGLDLRILCKTLGVVFFQKAH